MRKQTEKPIFLNLCIKLKSEQFHYSTVREDLHNYSICFVSFLLKHKEYKIPISNLI